ncbi:MAG: hypothetical protein K2Q20_04025 [Phycisphaerales bacterium]|nr:hypothetical protein [Phycisphaerales bacterium]
MPPLELPERPQTRLTLGPLLAEAWQLMVANYGLLLGMVAVWMGLSIAGGLVSAGLELIHTALSGLWDLATTFLVDAPLYAGVMMVGVRLARGERPTFDAMFDGFRSYGPIVLANLIKLPVIAIAIIISIAPFVAIALVLTGGRAGPAALIALAAVPVGLVVYAFLFSRLLLTEILILDRSGPVLGPIDALRLSWRITGPVTVTLMLLFLLGGVIAIGTTLLLVIGVILLGLPLLIALLGTAVRRMLESLDQPMCNHCGYNLSASAQPHCPECGRQRWRYARFPHVAPPPPGATFTPGG